MEKGIPKKIKLTDYDVLSTLGTGSFGRVKLAKHKQSGRFYALKMLKKSDIVKSKQVDHVMNENQILSMINHPFIVRNHSHRSIWRASVRTNATCTSSWNLSPAENSLHTCAVLATLATNMLRTSTL